ncbi:MAG: ABC transporter ATP-binding protein [Candidatus Saliniplasma sp.]
MKKENVIEVNGLIKRYDGTTAVKGISFNVIKGEVFSMVGPNGAGKTTTVEICEGIRKATSGTVHLFGKEFSKKSKRSRERIGVLPQEYRSFERLTVKETLKYYASFYKKNRDIEDIITLMDLQDKKEELYMNLSGGLKQRVGVGMALVNDPDLIFLDEPTTGLDPRARRGVWRAINTLKKEGKTIFLTTHYMEEAEYLADRVAIIHQGNIVGQGTLDQLISKHGGHYTVFIHGFGKNRLDILGKDASINSNNTASVRVESPSEISRILSKIIDNKINFENIEVRRANLEEVFLNLTGTTIEESDAA